MIIIYRKPDLQSVNRCVKYASDTHNIYVCRYLVKRGKRFFLNCPTWYQVLGRDLRRFESVSVVAEIITILHVCEIKVVCDSPIFVGSKRVRRRGTVDASRHLQRIVLYARGEVR